MNYRDEFDDNRGTLTGAGDFLASVGPKIALGTVVVAFLSLIGVLWFSYPSGDQGAQTVPIVRADNAPFKVDPDDPGGMRIANRDSTILQDSMETGVTENLLAGDDVEEPMPRSQLFAGLNTEGQEGEIKDSIAVAAQNAADNLEEDLFSANAVDDAAMIPEEDLVFAQEDTIPDLVAQAPPQPAAESPVEETEAMVVEEVVPVEKAIEEPVAVPKTAAAPAPAPAPAPVKSKPVTKPNDMIAKLEQAKREAEAAKEAARKADEEATKAVSQAALQRTITGEPMTESQVQAYEPAAGTASASAIGGGYYVQVGSVRDASVALSEWTKLRTKYSGALSGASYRVQRADLGAKGVFHRIQAGPYSKAEADSVCSRMKATQAGACFVVKE